MGTLCCWKIGYTYEEAKRAAEQQRSKPPAPKTPVQAQPKK